MPAGVPREIVSRASATIASGLNHPQTRARILDMGGLVVANSPEEFASFFKSEAQKWAKVAKAANVAVD